MKFIGKINGALVKSAEVARFVCTFACKDEKELRALAFPWVAKHVSHGWTPITDLMIGKLGEGEGHDHLFEVFYLGVFVGADKSKKIPVRFFHTDDKS